MFNFSANTGYLWKELPFLERIKMAKLHGFNSIEFHDEPYLEDTKAIKNLTTKLELTVNSMNVQKGASFGCAAIPGKTKKARQEILKGIKIAEGIGAKALHVLSGINDYNTTSLDTFKSNLKFALENSNILILIEPVCSEQVPGYFLRTIEQAHSIIKTLNHPRLNIIFDCYHIFKESGNLVENFEAYSEKIGHVQIAAAEKRAEPFSGQLDYTFLLPKFQLLGYKGPFGCEYRPANSTEDGLGWRDNFSETRYGNEAKI